MSNNTKHQRLLAFLFSLLDYFFEKFTLGEAFLAGVPMSIKEADTARQPDIIVVLAQHLERVLPTALNGLADVVIEIVSPESGAQDRGEKFIEYEAAGVPEYWLIDPIRTTAQFFALSEDKHYRPLPLDAQGRLTSNVLEGFALDPEILWQEELPRQSAARALVDAMPRRA
jgi:Uma2 family endonuclease